MKKIYDKDEVWFAIIWIVIYVVGFGNADMISESLGMPKMVTALLGLILTIILYGFVKKYELFQYYGLCRIKENLKEYAYFIPLIVISFVNLWGKLSMKVTWVECIIYIISMCFVGILEEVIFRGFLFKGMSKINVKVAIIVSSITFGMGHVVNLLMGAELFETLLQLIYASAIGFCYTAVFCASGSIVPCIISHIFVNSTSIFAVELTPMIHIVFTIVQTVLSISFGVWLLQNKKRGKFVSAILQTKKQQRKLRA